MTVRPVGLIVLHGIGQQEPGLLCDRVSRHLADDSSQVERGASGAVRLTSTGGSPIAVCEANWSAQSSPDNLPVVRVGLDLLRAFVDMLRSVISEPPLVGGSVSGRGVQLVNLAVLLLFVSYGVVLGGASVGIDACKVILETLGGLGRRLEDEELAVVLVLDCILLALWVPLSVAWSRSESVAALRARPGLLPRLKRIFVVVFAPLAMVLAIELGLFFIGFVTVTTVLSLVAASLSWIVVEIVRGVSRILSLARAGVLSKWLNRLAWVMLVLPVQSFMQACKATTNLIGIVLFDHRGARKAVASAWMPGVYVLSLVLMLFCEFLLFPFLTLLLPGAPSPGWGPRIEVAGLLMVVYLPLVGLFLPAVDLLLDVSNYHLASQEERVAYQEVIDRALGELAAYQCRSVHVLAHSLGSVIVYDWLRQRGQESGIDVLHTIGSPLNKFWYVDHSRSQRRVDESGTPPVRAWHNYWARSDLVSGALRRYGPSVENTRLRKLGFPIWNHVAYWKDASVKEGIQRSITQPSSAGEAIATMA